MDVKTVNNGTEKVVREALVAFFRGDISKTKSLIANLWLRETKPLGYDKGDITMAPVDELAIKDARYWMLKWLVAEAIAKHDRLELVNGSDNIATYVRARKTAYLTLAKEYDTDNIIAEFQILYDIYRLQSGDKIRFMASSSVYGDVLRGAYSIYMRGNYEKGLEILFPLFSVLSDEWEYVIEKAAAYAVRHMPSVRVPIRPEGSLSAAFIKDILDKTHFQFQEIRPRVKLRQRLN